MNSPIKLNRQKQLICHPEKIIQFGEGNFLRAFVDWMISETNNRANFNGSIVITNATKNGNVDKINSQDGLFTLFTQGLNNDTVINTHVIVDSISRGINPYTNYKDFLNVAKQEQLRFVISNTTEAGIYFDPEDISFNHVPTSFPAKLTALLFTRFNHFHGEINKGLIILPCELIEDNGIKLKSIVVKYANFWHLGNAFILWLDQANIFCDTLVDRIVSGYPKNNLEHYTKQLNYTDNAIVVAEYYHLWVIKSPYDFSRELPLISAGLNVKWVNDLTPYRIRKVRILNGLHTAMTAIAYLNGITTVREAVEDRDVGRFIGLLANEIIASLPNKDEAVLKEYYTEVLARFKNPYLEHNLLSIALNSFAKFNARVMPSILDYYQQYHEYPFLLTFALASLIIFYEGKYNGNAIALNDDLLTLNLLKNCWNNYNNTTTMNKQIVTTVLSAEHIWGRSFSSKTELILITTKHLTMIKRDGMLAALLQIIKKVNNL